MPIERKDRSFDLIFDQVTMDQVPADYIEEVHIHMLSGETVTLTKEDLLLIRNSPDTKEDIISTLIRDDMSEISLKLDYDAIKSDVLSGVTNFLGKYFDDK